MQEQVSRETRCSQRISLSYESKDVNEIQKIMFTKPYTIKEGEFGSVSVNFSTQFTSFYGNGGKAANEGEGEVKFTMKLCEDMPYFCGLEAGQLPEIYYYV